LLDSLLQEMIMRLLILHVIPFLLGQISSSPSSISRGLDLDYETVVKLAGLPLECMYTIYPNRLSQTLNSPDDLKPPPELHPTFYGCFDWHSSVHGHWLLAKVGNLFPDSEIYPNVSSRFEDQFNQTKIQKELDYFQSKSGKTFERTYGWAWLLKLQFELQSSENEEFRRYAEILKPLADEIAALYVDFLPRLVYPVRVGEHSNTAFGLIFAFEYARLDGNELLEESIRNVSKTFFLEDRACPLNYEPSGSDFLSPCLQEADLMSRILEDREEYTGWLENFLPQLFKEDFILEPGEVVDRTDGKLVHLDGLNFSRAWNLYNIARKITDTDKDMFARLLEAGDNHIIKSIDFVVGSDYAGSHWLASFLLHALEVRHQFEK